LYILLCGYPPFYGNSDPEILESVKKGKLEFDGPEWKSVSESGKDLIRKMVNKPEARLYAEEVLKHPWMTQESKNDASIDFNRFKRFVNSNKLQVAVLEYIVSQV